LKYSHPALKTFFLSNNQENKKQGDTYIQFQMALELQILK